MELPKIQNHEYLFRRIINNHLFWKKELNRHTSAAFKQSNGLSVDRNYERTDEEVIQVYKDYDILAIAKINCGECREIPTFPIYKPLQDNLFHCEIHGSEAQIQLSQKQIKALSLKAFPIWIKSN